MGTVGTVHLPMRCPVSTFAVKQCIRKGSAREADHQIFKK
jgi:hypothetical protein